MLQPPHQSLQVAAVPAAARSSARRDKTGPGTPRRCAAGTRQDCSSPPPRSRRPPGSPARRRRSGVCARCPVMVECREHALLQPEPYGVWGGLTAAERRVVLARRRRREAELQERGRRTPHGAGWLTRAPGARSAHRRSGGARSRMRRSVPLRRHAVARTDGTSARSKSTDAVGPQLATAGASESICRIVPDLDRITSDWVVAVSAR